MKRNTTLFAIALCTLILAGCTSSPTDSTTTTSEGVAATKKVIETAADGTQVLELISPEISYDGEHGRENGRLSDAITATLTIDSSRVITAVQITQNPGKPKSQQYQDAFTQAIAGEVVGKSIDGLMINTVGGASNTSIAFNKALDSIRSQLTNG